MDNIIFTFPNGLKKALTLSYDDGVYQDKKLIEILNKYKLKCTFNLNSGILGVTSWTSRGVEISRMNLMDTLEVYKGHEVAVHTLNHIDLTTINKESIVKEVIEDKKNLESIFNVNIKGMAYPYGSCNDEVIKIIKELGLSYGRTVKSTHDFELPDKFLKWNPTCRHADDKLIELAKKFIENKSDDVKLFYLWGHSYEFDVNNNWEIIEEFAKYIGGRSDIWYATNGEIFDYISALEHVEIYDNTKEIINKSNIDIYVEVNGTIIKIESKKNFKL